MIPSIEHFVAVMDAEAREAREAAKLEPITITIADQEELQRLLALAKGNPKQIRPMIRRHLRGWSRETLEREKATA
jgi:DNA polymerase III delta subunit